MRIPCSCENVRARIIRVAAAVVKLNLTAADGFCACVLSHERPPRYAREVRCTFARWINQRRRINRDRSLFRFLLFFYVITFSNATRTFDIQMRVTRLFTMRVLYESLSPRSSRTRYNARV